MNQKMKKTAVKSFWFMSIIGLIGVVGYFWTGGYVKPSMHDAEGSINGISKAESVKKINSEEEDKIQMLLQSEQFKSLMDNPEFKELVRSKEFSTLVSNSNFVGVVQNPAFIKLISDPTFVDLIKSGKINEIETVQSKE